MKLDKKRTLASHILGVGKERIRFNRERLDEIKEAITRQDIRDLAKDKAITIKEAKGRKKIIRRKTRRRAGSIRKSVNTRKKEYMAITRKLRAYISELRKHGVLDSIKYIKLRKEIRAKNFRSKAHMKERISLMVKEN